MQTRVITLRFNGMLDGFDDGPLREFIKDKEVISVQDHFFFRNEQPYLAVLVNYALRPMTPERPDPKSGMKEARRDKDWREIVPAADIPLFDSLRGWRLERAKKDGVPPYVICTNRQLAAILAARPQTLGALGQIEGLGKATLARYGEEMLAVLVGAQAPPPVSEDKQLAETSNEQTERE